MLTVILEILGTAMMFFQPKRFMSAGVVSLRYFSCNRLFISSDLCSNENPFSNSLVQSRSAAAAGANLFAIGQNRVADAGMLAAAGANNHDVRNIHRTF